MPHWRVCAAQGAGCGAGRGSQGHVWATAFVPSPGSIKGCCRASGKGHGLKVRSTARGPLAAATKPVPLLLAGVLCRMGVAVWKKSGG